MMETCGAAADSSRRSGRILRRVVAAVVCWQQQHSETMKCLQPRLFNSHMPLLFPFCDPSITQPHTTQLSPPSQAMQEMGLGAALNDVLIERFWNIIQVGGSGARRGVGGGGQRGRGRGGGEMVGGPCGRCLSRVAYMVAGVSVKWGGWR